MIIAEADLIPDWLKDNLDKECPFCGSLYHVGYSPNGQNVTKHYCPNKQCHATLAMKLVFVWTLLKVPGIKYGNSMALIKRHSLTKHLQAIPLVLTEEKPSVDLATFMRLNCISGIDSSWGSICKDKKSVDEVLADHSAKSYLSEQDKVDIKEAEQYFNIVFPDKEKYEPVVRMLIMITGELSGMKTRDLFVVSLNKMYKGLLDLRYSDSPRRTGVTALIKETSTNTKGKIKIAQDYGIPIMTPTEFVLFVNKKIREKVGDDFDI